MFYRLLFLTCTFCFAHATFAQHDHHQYGSVDFEISCNTEAQEHFQAALAHLHHMMYDQARPVFEAAAEADPNCALAHWGIAMTSFQPLWAPTSDSDLARGKAAVETARSIGAATEREEAYLATVEAFFTDPDPPAPDRPSDHEARVKAWKNAIQQVHESYPDDVDAAALYGLAQVSYAMTQFSPAEARDYSREQKAGALLERYFQDHPEHPGLFHYIIHAYDSPKLAHKAEEVARGYGPLAPDTPHALHMPSHIFVRLGQWNETAEWNQRSAAAAMRQPVNGLTSLHYPHALDYMMYAYLQLGENEKARETLEKVRAIDKVQPHFASAYGIAAAQARYYLEQQKWAEAAQLDPKMPEPLTWDQYPGASALVHYARGLGAARSGDLGAAEAEAERIREAVAAMRDAGNRYWAHMTEALGNAVEAWVLFERGDVERGLALMRTAADLEDAMDKHPISPGEVLPVRELYGELLFRAGHLDEAEAAFRASLERTPNRRNALTNVEMVAAASK